MRRGELFWGVVLLVLGALFFLKAAGYLTGDVFGWFWPLLIMFLGLWLVFGLTRRGSRYAAAEKFSVPLQDAQRATLAVEHGAGEIKLRAGAEPGNFLTGIVGTGMNHSEWRDGDRLLVRLEAGPSFIPFLGPEGGAWEYRLSRDIPIDLSIHSGASRLDLDLTELQVTNLSFDGGASRITLNLPAGVGNTMVNVRAGAARLDLTVPPGVALRLRSRATGNLDIDEARFPRVEDGVYQSRDFGSAQHCADVTLDGGATSIHIH